ncbi:MAG: L-erythro-3,5-diaminohexanoate dehydrogenase, partial [Tissierellia bacterium]|nr:L-erythro-3,5-diaminohexanoate dehydrogenase [Tissierellia bacterium]
KSLVNVKKLELADDYIVADATDGIGVSNKIKELTKGELCDTVIVNVNIQNCEMAAILSAKEGGTVYFFSMATDFPKASLGAEGVFKDINMIVGNGYCKGHANTALQILRESVKIRKLYTELYA